MSLQTEHRPLIWITDDNAMEARITERALGASYDHEYFADGANVIERLVAGARQPDVLLLDWMMPGVSGDEVCRFLRSQPHTRELPIIIVTASRIETTDVVEGLAIGANDYLARPFAEAELRARVDNAIRAKRLRESASRERHRLDTINRLGRAFVAVGGRLDAVLDVLASTLVETFIDGCTISVLPGIMPGTTIARHRTRLGEHLLAGFAVADPCNVTFASAAEARAALPATYHPAIARFGIGALAVVPFPDGSPISGVVTITRDQYGRPFEAEDLVTVQTCLEYAALAFEKALRFDAEQAMRRQLQTILEHMPVSIIVAEPSGVITHTNQTTMELSPAMKTRSVHEVHEHMKLTTFDGEPIPSDESPLARALRGETVRGLEVEAVFDGGRSYFLRTSAVPLFDGKGEVSSAILALDDITAERTAAIEREQAAEFQRYVLGIVSHDLRSPLQTLMMGCEGIRMVAGDQPKILQYLERMERTSGRMRGIIEQLLDVVRSQLGGGIPVTANDVALQDIVANVVNEMALAHPAAQFERKLAPVRGNWDRDRLAQVVANLVGNALQHGARGTPVWIETAQQGADALLRVRNRTVTPLTAEQTVSIFAPFRGTKGPTGRNTGLGLGLYIASEILRAHQGEISVESDPDYTTFIVRIPIRPAVVS